MKDIAQQFILFNFQTSNLSALKGTPCYQKFSDPSGYQVIIGGVPDISSTYLGLFNRGINKDNISRSIIGDIHKAVIDIYGYSNISNNMICSIFNNFNFDNSIKLSPTTNNTQTMTLKTIYNYTQNSGIERGTTTNTILDLSGSTRFVFLKFNKLSSHAYLDFYSENAGSGSSKIDNNLTIYINNNGTIKNLTSDITNLIYDSSNNRGILFNYENDKIEVPVHEGNIFPNYNNGSLKINDGNSYTTTDNVNNWYYIDTSNINSLKFTYKKTKITDRPGWNIDIIAIDTTDEHFIAKDIKVGEKLYVSKFDNYKLTNKIDEALIDNLNEPIASGKVIINNVNESLIKLQ